MNEDDRNRLFIEGVKVQLDASLEAVGEEIGGRLHQARRRALEEGGARRKSTWQVFQIPVMGVAAAAILFIAFLMCVGGPSKDQTITEVEHLELFASKESLELLVNLEFYQWLSEEEVNDVG